MKRVLIIGIRGTIGAALAHKLSGLDGYDVRGTTSFQSIETERLYYLNLENESAITNFSTNISFDHLIITSGYEPRYNLSETSNDHIQKMFQIHVTGPLLFLKQIRSYLNRGGSIVFISSPSSQKGSYDPAYAAVKGAVNALVRTLAKDLSPDLRVNALSPSLIKDSPVYNRMTDDFRQRHLNNTLTKNHTTADDCAEAIIYLINASQLTGQIIHLNGGMIFGN